jgi:hypothetical protein
MFDVDEMIRHGNVYICANCKPVFLQKLGEGLASGYRSGRRSLPVNADQLMNEITARDYEVNIGHCISRAWNLVKSNFWLTVGATFLIMVCNQAAGFIPFLGVILSLIIQGPLFGGLNILFLKLARGEEATIGDAFAGFSKSFWRLCGTFLLMALLLYVWFVPAVVYVFAMSDGNNSFGLPFWILGGIAFFIVMYLGVAFGLALVLSADLELGPWDALRVSRRIVTRKWLSFFGLFVVAGLINLLGLLACFIGVLATMPIFYAAVVYAYEDIFGVEPAHEPAA